MVDPTGLWDFKLDIGKGVAGRLHVGYNDGNLTIGRKLGAGL